METYAFLTIDSWHLDGTHCPVYESTPINSLESNIERVKEWIERRGIRKNAKTAIDVDKMAEDMIEKSYTHVFFEYPREGYIVMHSK